MIKKYFGTDGIRGTVNKFPMTPNIAQKVGMVVGKKFTKNNYRGRVVIGKDTRLSGYIIETALTSGFASTGLDVFLVGPVPTPAVSMLTKSLRADIGVMISASHNPYQDNGIKIFDHNGRKLNDEIENDIEKQLDLDITEYLADPDKLGKVIRLEDAPGRYIEYVKNTFPKNQNLNNLTIVVDCANGASYSMAPTILKELGATVISIGVEPNGCNINDGCGSTNTKLLQQEVINNNADIGIALDGDADRVAIIDEKGNEVAGDKIIGLIADKLHQEGKLKKDSVVITQMSNLGLEHYLQYMGIVTLRTKVGDRYVLDEMQKGGYNFGGEQSGHIILGDHSTTGDGLIASLQLLSIITENKEPVSKVSDIFPLIPQILKNIACKDKNCLNNTKIQKFIQQKQEQLKDNGRVFVRKSGTENLIRIMIEGKDLRTIENIAEEIAYQIKSA